MTYKTAVRILEKERPECIVYQISFYKGKWYCCLADRKTKRVLYGGAWTVDDATGAVEVKSIQELRKMRSDDSESIRLITVRNDVRDVTD